ncbi:toxin-antitoxin system HicB family antitoxin [Eggerthella guodeyinii]|uniref:Toxin-antitoxin system HicB family antitoxin n=1 Tax=Eggerthella guodeyinii TaxID=2690837 RepID=A0A6L7IUK3_9ACTN|nr:toxin-antitoxin system HicB family antitoxin [Eggerthella guodeyinii]QOS69565.1 toxin-antitoxin system HicB family antitoxin [Eggerthella guodeyinii]
MAAISAPPARVGSELHERAALKAAEKGESLNQFVAEAIAASV